MAPISMNEVNWSSNLVNLDTSTFTPGLVVSMVVGTGEC